MAGIPTGVELPVLHDFVIFHDALNYATAASWLCGYIALLQKLRRDRSAIGLSMQTLTALVISECNTLIIILLFYLLNHIEFGIGFVLCDVATVVISAWTLLIIHRKFFKFLWRRPRRFWIEILPVFTEGVETANSGKTFIISKKNTLGISLSSFSRISFPHIFLKEAIYAPFPVIFWMFWRCIGCIGSSTSIVHVLREAPSSSLTAAWTVRHIFTTCPHLLIRLLAHRSSVSDQNYTRARGPLGVWIDECGDSLQFYLLLLHGLV